MKSVVLSILTLASLNVFAGGKKPLAERLVTLNTAIDYDTVYNEALEEMQNLNPAEKTKLSKELEKILLTDKNTERRANAASALGDICSDVKTNDAALSKAAKDKEKIVRQAIASGITRCGGSTTTIATLKQFLKDADATVRTMAEVNLEKLGAK